MRFSGHGQAKKTVVLLLNDCFVPCIVLFFYTIVCCTPATIGIHEKPSTGAEMGMSARRCRPRGIFPGLSIVRCRIFLEKAKFCQRLRIRCVQGFVYCWYCFCCRSSRLHNCPLRCRTPEPAKRMPSISLTLQALWVQSSPLIDDPISILSVGYLKTL